MTLVTLAQTAAAAAADSIAADTARVLVPAASEKAIRYFEEGNALWVAGVLWSLAVPAFFLFTGLSARLRDVGWRVGRKWFFAAAVYFILYQVFTGILDLPLAWVGFLREHSFGLSDQTVAKWARDAAISTGLSAFLAALFLWIPFRLFRASPRRWWLWTTLAALPLIVLGNLVFPIWVSPLFNHFGPMHDTALEQRIIALAHRAGIDGAQVYEVAKSVDTNTVNAYVAGIGGTKRIVIWDTLLRRLNDRQTLAVVAHEMGHYVLGHVWMGMIASALGLLVGLWLIHVLSGPILTRFSRRFDFDRLSDFAALPLLILLGNLLGLVGAPAALAFTRHLEHEADRFALELTHDNHALATAFAELQEQNLAMPRPGRLYVLFRASHPPLGSRIDFANTYRPWEAGEPGRYGDRFLPPSGDALPGVAAPGTTLPRDTAPRDTAAGDEPPGR